ncbi:MAG: methyltransferase domain-containing protein [Gammaproteobacteria bacterium]|nr:methyltransferase domain-containing protein [Gammaproteobacteria bacterium]
MEKSLFSRMWDKMQSDGYFARHPHYQDHFGAELSRADRALDNAVLQLDFSQEHVEMPVPYSDALERSVKRTEAQWLGRMFALPETGTVLDVGCGFGRSMSWFADRYPQVIGTDISATVLDSARERLKDRRNVRLLVNESDTLPTDIADGSIALAYVFTVFQHIPREFTANLLRGITRVLADDGVVIFNLLTNVNEAVNTGDSETEWAIGYSPAQAEALLAGSGLSAIKMCTWSTPGSDAGWLWVQAGLQPRMDG